MLRRIVFDRTGGMIEHTLDGIAQPLQAPSNPIVPEPVPQSEWPIWAKALKRFAKPEDKGIGDVVARKIGDEKSKAFKKWYKRIFGKECGCDGRQAQWNQMYPLPVTGKS